MWRVCLGGLCTSLPVRKLKKIRQSALDSILWENKENKMPLQSRVSSVNNSKNRPLSLTSRCIIYEEWRPRKMFYQARQYVHWWQNENDSQLPEYRKWGRKVCLVCESRLANRVCHSLCRRENCQSCWENVLHGHSSELVQHDFKKYIYI